MGAARAGARLVREVPALAARHGPQVKRTALKRKAWMKRGTKRLERGARIKPINPERLARRRDGTDTVEGTDGPQSDYCRAAPCFACGAPPPSDPEHVRPRGSGGKDRDTAPLCRTCHGFRHARGVAALDRRYLVDLRAEARRLAAIYHPRGEVSDG